MTGMISKKLTIGKLLTLLTKKFLRLKMYAVKTGDYRLTIWLCYLLLMLSSVRVAISAARVQTKQTAW
jgi:hypothetical protein